jgi:hypothetical protein
MLCGSAANLYAHLVAPCACLYAAINNKLSCCYAAHPQQDGLLDLFSVEPCSSMDDPSQPLAQLTLPDDQVNT